MENELTYSALNAIGMATGAALCASLGLMQFRVDRATGGRSGYQLLWVVGFIWTLGRFLRYTLQLAGLETDAIGVRLAESLSWSCTILGPVAIGRLVQARLVTTTGRAGAFLAFTWIVSLLNLSLFAWVVATRALAVDASWYPRMSLYIALAVTAVALILHRLGRHEAGAGLAASTSRSFGRGAFLLAVLQVSAALLSLRNSWLPTGLHATLSLIGEHWARTPAEVAEQLIRTNAAARSRPQPLQHVLAIQRDRYLLIPLDDVCFFRVEDGVTKVKTRDACYSTRYAIGDLEAGLSCPLFFRAHRSVIANLERVAALSPLFKGALLLTMKDTQNSEIQVSERQSKILRELIQL